MQRPSSPGELSPAARALAAEQDPDALAVAVTDEIMSVVFPANGDDDFYDAVYVSTRDNIRAIRDVQSGRIAIADTAAEGALQFAATAAELGVPYQDVERAYRIGVATYWRLWFERACGRAGVAGAEVADLAEETTMALFAYIDHILSPVQASYDSTREELLRTREQLRRSLLARILDGTLTAEEGDEEVEDALGCRLAETHLALLVHESRTGAPGTWLAPLRAATGARSVVHVRDGARSWMVWLSRPEPFTASDLARLRRALADGEFVAAVGEQAPGLEGLRRSHGDAVEAAEIQHVLGAEEHPVVWADELRLERLLLQDEERARRFVAAELGPLAASDARARRLRETISTWFATGSHGGAAGLLGVHKNTVRNRIRDAEALLGAPLWSRPTELQAALRLDRLLRAR